MRKGRVSKSTELKLLEGVQPCRINRNEPKPVPGLGPAPEWFAGYELECWHNLQERVDPMRITGQSDIDAAIAYCYQYATFREARLDLIEHGITLRIETVSETKYGQTIKRTVRANPAIRTINEAMGRMLAFQREFGMTPAARSQIRVEPAATEDDANVVGFFDRKPKLG